MKAKMKDNKLTVYYLKPGAYKLKDCKSTTIIMYWQWRQFALGAWLQNFYTVKVITSDLQTVVQKNVYPLHHGASFNPILVSFCFQIIFI